MGRIIDEMNGEPIEYATVTLHSLPDSVMVGGLVTDQLGKFEFSSLTADPVFLSARFMGYESYTFRGL